MRIDMVWKHILAQVVLKSEEILLWSINLLIDEINMMFDENRYQNIVPWQLAGGWRFNQSDDPCGQIE